MTITSLLSTLIAVSVLLLATQTEAHYTVADIHSISNVSCLVAFDNHQEHLYIQPIYANCQDYWVGQSVCFNVTLLPDRFVQYVCPDPDDSREPNVILIFFWFLVALLNMAVIVLFRHHCAKYKGNAPNHTITTEASVMREIRENHAEMGLENNTAVRETSADIDLSPSTTDVLRVNNPTFGMKNVLIRYVTGANVREDVCAICLSSLRGSIPVCILLCSHQYHKQCIIPWLVVSHKCPICREYVRLSGETSYGPRVIDRTFI